MVDCLYSMQSLHLDYYHYINWCCVCVNVCTQRCFPREYLSIIISKRTEVLNFSDIQTDPEEKVVSNVGKKETKEEENSTSMYANAQEVARQEQHGIALSDLAVYVKEKRRNKGFEKEFEVIWCTKLLVVVSDNISTVVV